MSEKVVRQLASLEQSVRRLEASLDRGIKSIIEELRSIQGEFKNTRKEMGRRLLALLAQQITLDYIEISSRENAIKKQLSYMEQKTEEARRIVRERFKEVINSYLGVVRDYLSQFLNMSEGEFMILQKLLIAERRAESIHELIKPSWINDELVRAALGFDMNARAENLETLISNIERIRTIFIAQRESLGAAGRTISNYSLPSGITEPGTILYLPFLVVELEVDGKTLVGIKRPLDSDAPLVKLLADQVLRVRSEYAMEVSKEDLEQIAEKIATLAVTADEKKLFEKVKVEVV
ncbi:MAG: hypothetical protein QXU69_05385 [Thermofilaceae archaeon]|uniref:Uncharacterized protein n=1 Tax=Thermofilum pendens TaxID=2269 RepID=A0A7C4D1S7_THEPE